MGASRERREVSMTQHKDLKRRIRERMDKTGESYTAARAQVLAQRPEPSLIPVVEPRHLTEEAVALGLQCKVLATDGFDARRAVETLRELLLATDDADLDVMRAAVLYGLRPKPLRWSIVDVRRFLVRARGGLGGVAPGGWLLAFVSEGVMLLATLSLMRGGAPCVWLRRIDAATSDELTLAGITLR
jgi:hypothetical protein